VNLSQRLKCCAAALVEWHEQIDGATHLWQRAAHVRSSLPQNSAIGLREDAIELGWLGGRERAPRREVLGDVLGDGA